MLNKNKSNVFRYFLVKKILHNTRKKREVNKQKIEKEKLKARSLA
jgi:hypothetical protein